MDGVCGTMRNMFGIGSNVSAFSRMLDRVFHQLDGHSTQSSRVRPNESGIARRGQITRFEATPPREVLRPKIGSPSGLHCARPSRVFRDRAMRENEGRYDRVRLPPFLDMKKKRRL